MKIQKPAGLSETEVDYLEFGWQLLKQYKIEIGLEEDREAELPGHSPFTRVQADEFAYWVMGQEGRIDEESWNKCKASALFLLKYYKGSVVGMEILQGIVRTRTSETEATYLKRGLGLLKRYKESIGHEDDPEAESLGWSPFRGISVVGFVDWLIGLRSGLTKNSWRGYKAWAIYLLEYYKGPIEATRKLKSAGQSECKRESNKTSAQKKKSITKKELEMIIGALDSEDIKVFGIDYILKNWLIAGVATGLRPSEWKRAYYDKTKNALVVKNAKSTNGRSYGKARTLEFADDIPDDIKDAIINLSEFLNEKNYRKIYEQAKNRLYKVTRKIWPKRKKWPTLYSCRHQKVADNKKRGDGLIETAAVCGQKSPDTSAKHYGRRSSGDTVPAYVSASAEDIAAVEELNPGYEYKGYEESKQEEQDQDPQEEKGPEFSP